MAQRLSFIELATKATTVKTFDKRVYELKGLLAVDQEDGCVKDLADVYYRVRTALDSRNSVVAKRKNDNEELTQPNKRRHKKKKVK